MSVETSRDERVVEALDEYIAQSEGELVQMLQTMVRFNTVSVDLEPGSEHTTNDEKALQEFIGGRLSALGAEIDQWEPAVAELRDHPMMPSWHHWNDRPITVGLLRGSGGGRSLIINGHIDVVSAGDEERWTSPPFAAEIRDGRVYGRGAVDMKGGIAAAICALEALKAAGVKLKGDVIVEAVTDEETCAMGTVAAIQRGYRADGGLVPEPTGLNFWIATRGLLHGSFTVPGRSAHAEMNQCHWRAGGGVNSIAKAAPLIAALDQLSSEWATRDDKQHRLLGSPQAQPTVVSGGAFISNVPESCQVHINATYLPGNADDAGYGTFPRREIQDRVEAIAREDDWLAANDLVWSWATDYPPSEIDRAEEILRATGLAVSSLGFEPKLEGIDTTYDGALLTRLAGVPSPAFGPGDLSRAHALDEWIGIDELVLGARAYARAICEWCSVS